VTQTRSPVCNGQNLLVNDVTFTRNFIRLILETERLILNYNRRYLYSKNVTLYKKKKNQPYKNNKILYKIPLNNNEKKKMSDDIVVIIGPFKEHVRTFSILHVALYSLTARIVVVLF